MTAYFFPPRPQPALAVTGEQKSFPIARIFCVGRNYVAHAEEMGNTVDRSAPFYFNKSAHDYVNTGEMAYPPGTSNLHHEAELVVAIDAPASRVAVRDAMDCVFGYAAGLDMTRRDLQATAKEKRRPWDTAKDFEQSAIIGDLTKAADVDLAAARITLDVNGDRRQDAPLADMVWSVPELIAHLSTLYALAPGDLIMTGTPAGVGPVVKGDMLECRVDGLSPLNVKIV